MNTMMVKTPLVGALSLNAQMSADQMTERGAKVTLASGVPKGFGGRGDRPESVRHILLGSPEAVRQTIHLLHALHYAETVLWSPVLTVEEPFVISPAQNEAMSLLRRPA